MPPLDSTTSRPSLGASLPIIVQKYGGTSVGPRAHPGRGRPGRGARRRRATTSSSSSPPWATPPTSCSPWRTRSPPTPEPRELDMLLTAGERIAMSLLAIAINAAGCRGRRYTGSQAGHHHRHRRTARPGSSRSGPSGSTSRSQAGNVVIVAGFQGVVRALDITTLGRGGSDTTAVAMAAALGADVCEIYTDVTACTRPTRGSCRRARKLDVVSLRGDARAGRPPARRCCSSVRWSTRGSHGVPVHVRSSFTDEPGTWVRRRTTPMEQALDLRRRARRPTRRRSRSTACPTGPAWRRAVFRALADDGHQRRHDRAERLARRRDRPLVHRADAPTSPRAARRRRARRRGDRRRERFASTTASRRSRWSARA